MAEALDFQIDTMKFRLAVDNTYYSSNNTGRRYVRSTAPFRKEQVDTSATPGDNSLTGWWVHGQLSFHKGAGVDYFDVSSARDSADVLYGFKDSMGVEALTAGKVMLAGYPRKDPVAQNGSYWDDFSSVGDGMLVGIQEYAGGADGSSAKVFKFSGSGPTGTEITTNTTYGDPSRIVPATSGNWFIVSSGATYGVCLERKSTSTVGWQPDGVIYTNLPSANIFFAKGRLWVIQDSGEVYTLDPNPGGTLPVNFPASTPAVTLPAGTGTAQLAETPGAVYAAMGSNQIYRIDLASDGSVPTLAAPVVVATLPSGETVASLREHLGYLCIATTDAVRVAVINSDGSLTYGPSLLSVEKGTKTCRIGAHVDRFLVCAKDRHDGNTYVWAIDLSEPKGNPLQFPIERLAQLTDDGSWRTFGITEWGADGWAAWCGVSCVVDQCVPYNYVNTTGWLETPVHRFGTLDPKAFVSVTITTEDQSPDGWSSGSGIGVYYSNESVTDYYLGWFGAAGAMEFPIPAQYQNAVGASLKFEFSRDTSGDLYQGRVLVGYQLRALPVPKRQRLIQVPLLLRDVITTANGRKTGREGDAWKNLQALESLESSKAIVTYEDFRTGETGTAYIDGVEFTGDIETSHRTREFGGIAYVELRVIS